MGKEQRVLYYISCVRYDELGTVVEIITVALALQEAQAYIGAPNPAIGSIFIVQPYCRAAVVFNCSVLCRHG